MCGIGFRVWLNRQGTLAEPLHKCVSMLWRPNVLYAPSRAISHQFTLDLLVGFYARHISDLNGSDDLGVKHNLVGSKESIQFISFHTCWWNSSGTTSLTSCIIARDNVSTRCLASGVAYLIILSGITSGTPPTCARTAAKV
jgi:hypothetical protein